MKTTDPVTGWKNENVWNMLKSLNLEQNMTSKINLLPNKHHKNLKFSIILEIKEAKLAFVAFINNPLTLLLCIQLTKGLFVKAYLKASQRDE